MTETLQNGKKAAVLKALAAGNTRRAAAAAAGIAPDTFYRWIAEDRTLSDAVKKAEAEAEAYFLNHVKAAAPDNWQAAAWWLERRRSGDYAKNDKLHVIASMAKDLQGMSDEQLSAIAYGGDEPDPEALSAAGAAP